MSDSSESPDWHAPCYKGRRNACRRKREAERLSRMSSNEETSEREKTKEPIRHTLTALNNAPTQSFGVQGKGVRRRTRSKGSKKKNSRGKRSTKRRRH